MGNIVLDVILGIERDLESFFSLNICSVGVEWEMRDYRRPRPKKLGVIRKSQRYFPADMPDFPTIVNVPLHPKTGQPIMKKKDIQERKKVRKGMHTHWFVLLIGERDEVIHREVLE